MGELLDAIPGPMAPRYTNGQPRKDRNANAHNEFVRAAFDKALRTHAVASDTLTDL